MVTSRKTVLITGGAGFIGSHLAERCLAEGHRVIAIDNLSTGRLGNIEKGITFLHADICDPSITTIFQKEKPDIVFHLAAQISLQNSLRNPIQDAQTNTLGTINLLHASKTVGIQKFIYSSTGGALYGEPEYFPCDENHPITPLSPYGQSKYFGEQYIQLYSRLFRLNYVSLRYSNIYGPRQDPKGEAGVVAIFTNNMLDKKTPTIFGDGSQTRDFLYVSDVVNANILALSEKANGAYNIGSGIETSVISLYRELSALLHFKKEPDYRPARTSEVSRIALDSTKALTEMGWKPEVELQKGLAITAEYIAANRNPN
ncbi:NAD-dependent epimerase/dehydratase family protein [SAR202 cluster bacterium AC-409-J13_OGT_754m]|nr:NAD-dependent epimerase/dehydratase family protein [SAR202 cluster bacterium AC-409-J13_OGT_754m]